MTETIGNPLSWGVDAAKATGQYVGAVSSRLGSGDAGAEALPRVRKIDMNDLREALRKGIDDFAACRSDVVFLCLLYPAIGGVLAFLAMRGNMLPLVFPFVAGFALMGPVVGTGLYEMSRRRELGLPTDWATAFSVVKSPSFAAIFVLGLVLLAIFIVWLIAAHGIWAATLGPEPPASVGAFLREVLTTPAGWAMVLIGFGVGFLFAAAVLAISVVSFPLLLDRPVGMPAAVVTSFHVAVANPGPIAAWGLIVATALALGSIPVFLGLVVVLPVLGHATWHLYRRAVEPPEVSAETPPAEMPAAG
jgi:uncharacterized membrane protein